MNFAKNYFIKHTFLTPQIKEPPTGLLSFIVVIPAYLEENIIETLECLNQTSIGSGALEVIVVFNYSETDPVDHKELNKAQFRQTKEWASMKSTSTHRFFPVLTADLPKKHAGAGLARKIGMDEALSRFSALNKPDGIILSLDADTSVQQNYLTAIEKTFKLYPNAGGCLIPFSHPLDGTKYSSDVYKAITLYELHMRYYKHMLEFTGFPFANYTVGSCFGVKAEVYANSGGMNRRKAGEDFYFLNKLFPHYFFPEVRGTTVYPSPRPSLRVPFGTGPVIDQLIRLPEKNFFSYNAQAFSELRNFFSAIPEFYPYDKQSFDKLYRGLSYSIRSFLEKSDFSYKISEIANNTSTPAAFIKRFYLWFDGFRVVKYLNFVHEEIFAKQPVSIAASDFLKRKGMSADTCDERELLQIYRKLDLVI